MSGTEREEDVRRYDGGDAAAGAVDEQALLIDSEALGAKEWAKVHRPGAVHEGHAGEVPALSRWLARQPRVIPHAASDTTVVIEALCRRAALRRALLNWRVLLRTFRGDIAALLARRAASMARAWFLSAGDA